MKNKEKYRTICKKEKTIPIFSKDWWLDAVCGKDNWDVILINKNNSIIAALPYYTKRKYGFKLITSPKLTPTIGVWIKYPENQSYTKKLSYEKRIFTELVEKLPKFDYFSQNLHNSITNWLPFYWKGFKQTTGYTYVINEISDLKNVKYNMTSNLRNKINKAAKTIKITECDDLKSFYKINKMTYERQKLFIPYSFEFLEVLTKACVNHNCSKILMAKDMKGNIHAVIYIVWDDISAYRLISGFDPKYGDSGAASLIGWEAIKCAAMYTNSFDFEGSMLEGVEKRNRSFGAMQKPYLKITKINSKLLKLGLCLRDMYA